MAIAGSTLNPSLVTLYLQQANGTLAGLRQTRMSWWAYWASLAEVYLPKRYRWFITPNQWNRGSQMNAQIIDTTGVKAVQVCTSGMLSGMTSPTRQWFQLGLHDLAALPPGPVKNWLADCQDRMMRVMAESNFYTCLGQLYMDLIVFGSAAMLVYEDFDQVIRCQNPCLGEFFLLVGPKNTVDGLYREFTLTIDQAVTEFGIDNVSQSTRLAYQTGGALKQNEITICHAIEPNTQLYEAPDQPLAYLVPKIFKQREVFWEQMTQGYVAPNVQSLLRVSGFHEKIFVGGRWSVTSNDSYGSNCPGMNALPAVRQLQVEQKRKAQAIDKMVNPPMVASVSMKNEPSSVLPGAVNYVADISTAGFKPAYQVDPRLAEMMEDIADTRQSINDLFYVDLFLMISQLDTVRTATEIDARREEKLVQLGPVVERFENEVLDPIIDRVFAIMERRGLIPPPPPELQGQDINVQYFSMLAEAQKAAKTAGIERGVSFAGNLAAVDPSIMDNIDLDLTVQEYFDDLNLPPALLRNPEQVAAIRDARAKAQEQEQLLQATPAAVAGAKTLSETQVGGGQNALAAMVNG